MLDAAKRQPTPWRRQSARGDHSAVPSDGADKDRRATAGRHRGMTCRYPVRAASSGVDLTGAPGRPALGALHSALVGVQPTTVSGPRPSGPGKAAASSRFALHLRRASVVSTSEAGTDDAGNATPYKAAAVLSLNNG